MPFRSSSAATRVLTSSFGSESYAMTSPPPGIATESIAYGGTLIAPGSFTVLCS